MNISSNVAFCLESAHAKIMATLAGPATAATSARIQTGLPFLSRCSHQLQRSFMIKVVASSFLFCHFCAPLCDRHGCRLQV